MKEIVQKLGGKLYWLEYANNADFYNVHRKCIIFLNPLGDLLSPAEWQK